MRTAVDKCTKRGTAPVCLAIYAVTIDDLQDMPAAGDQLDIEGEFEEKGSG